DAASLAVTAPPRAGGDRAPGNQPGAPHAVDRAGRLSGHPAGDVTPRTSIDDPADAADADRGARSSAPEPDAVVLAAAADHRRERSVRTGGGLGGSRGRGDPRVARTGSPDRCAD